MKPQNDSYACIDLMDEFWHFFEQSGDLTLDQQIKLFKERIIEPNLQYYSYVFGINDATISKYIQESEPIIDELISGQASAIHRFRSSLKMFQARFPEFRTDFTIYLLPSLGLFKGMTVPFQGKVMLLLGIDGLVNLTDNQFNGYITHELFHAYHFQRSPAVRDAAELAMRSMQMPPLWGLLWTEGIACHAVGTVYPEIPEEEVLDWRLLLVQTKPLLPDLAREAKKTMLSASPQDIAGFFYFPRENILKFPTGCGYYIGMLVAGILTKKHPVDRLLDLVDEELIHEIDTALMELEFDPSRNMNLE